jgi:hypothetical protein
MLVVGKEDVPLQVDLVAAPDELGVVPMLQRRDLGPLSVRDDVLPVVVDIIS